MKCCGNVRKILLKANLKVNESKTDETVLERKNKGDRFSSKISGELKLTLTKETEKWRNTKKLGSLIGVSEDIRRRKQLSTAALIKMNNIWIRKDKIKQCLRLKLYKSLVKPILVYNAGTWSPTKKEEDELDAFHRQQLRKVMNVKYPVRMRNTVVYQMSGEEMLSVEIVLSRWKLFGHTLRLHIDTPAQRSMDFFFEESKAGRFRGRPRVNLPWKLNDDLIKYSGTDMTLKNADDLRALRELAQDRSEWTNLCKKIYVAAKAAKNIVTSD